MRLTQEERAELEAMTSKVSERENHSKDTSLRATDEPTTRLVLAIEGMR